MLKKLSKSCILGAHLNGRCEKHGEELVRAFDVRVTVMLTRKQLTDLTGNDQLWHAWFLESKEDGDQPLLEHFAPYRWKPKFENCKAQLEVGDSTGKYEIALGVCKLKGHVFTPLAGGQTEYSFTLQGLVDEHNVELLQWIGCEDAKIDIQLGNLVVAQQDLELDEEEGEEISDETTAAPRPLSGDDDRPTVN